MCGPDATPPSSPYVTQAHLRPSPVDSSASSSAKSYADGIYRCETFPMTYEGYTYESFLCYQVGRPAAPLVMVLPNYSGLKQFDKDQAMFMAKLGYVGLAVDLYKDVEGYRKEDRNPLPNAPVLKLAADRLDDHVKQVAKKHMKGAFGAMNDLLRDPVYWRGLMSFQLDQARTHPAVHPTHAAAIGYCFGGQCILEMVRGGCTLDGIVSFHGILQSNPSNLLQEPDFDGKFRSVAENKHHKAAKLLIENGDLDELVSDESIALFKEEMDGQGIDWRVHNHGQAKHGFALPAGVWATEYDEHADRRSTLSMISLFAELWPEFEVRDVERNAAGTVLRQHIGRSKL